MTGRVVDGADRNAFARPCRRGVLRAREFLGNSSPSSMLTADPRQVRVYRLNSELLLLTRASAIRTGSITRAGADTQKPGARPVRAVSWRVSSTPSPVSGAVGRVVMTKR